ncbi:MAG: hypothetical protein KIT17_28380 [Rubrivivax sp.]|nr:hypothetical protein [Rubrivivax sp.]
MKIRSVLAQAALAGALLFAAGSPALAQTYTKEQLQQTYMDYLQAEGFNPNITQQGNVRFRREGKYYIIYVDERDPEYFRLVLSFSADDKSAQARQRRLEGTNLATNETKVVKAYVDNDGDPNFACEMFLIVPGDFKTHLSRLLRAMDTAYDKYRRKVADQR